jgi:Protein of unknown function (DUF5818)
MPRILMLALALLCSTAWVQAQQDQYPQNPQNPPSGSSQAGTSAGETSVEGCLQGSNGNFALSDKSGTTYQLSGDTSKLSKHVGHEVQITGSTSASSAASSTSSMPQGWFTVADAHCGQGETYILKAARPRASE